MSNRPAILWKAATAIFLAGSAAAADFSRDIQPILAEHCAECHGGVKRKGGLSVLSRDLMVEPTEAGHVVLKPGNAKESELVARVSSTDPDERMPPKEPLTPEEIRLVTEWVNQGAEWPRHWSYAPVTSPEPPAVARPEWQSPIDRFILAKLEKEGVKPSPPADPRVLLRRLSLDLTGLLPVPADVEKFAANPSPQAYQAFVHQYLDSPHFGERWARHWLDEARYADSAGYEKDSARLDAWRWREWVIQSINEDLPFDQFTLKQIAGDLLPDATDRDRLATYFHLNTQFNLEGGVDAEEDRTKRVIDRISTVGSVWLAATVGCAQCHDHPYDPITQREFYEFYAFFNNADEHASFIGDVPKDAAALLAERKTKGDALLKLLDEQVTNKNLATQIQAELTRMQDYDNSKGFTRTLAQRTVNPRATYIFRRGDFLQPMTEKGPLSPGMPNAWPPLKPRGEIADRVDLAHWLISPDNPLPPRVTVNKVWERLFGAGLAPLMEDFGTRGEHATHPELLDWLAHWFVNDAGWSRKKLIEQIVTSQAYRQSSVNRLDLVETDPQNRFLARQNRLRVEAEIMRDIFLQSAGLLSPKIGGPSVFPPLPDVVVKQSYANNFRFKASAGEDRYRRGLYTFFKRTATDPNLILFDCPEASRSTAGRDVSNTPLQALATLDNEVFAEAAVAMARRLLAETKSDDEALALAYRIALGRPADLSEAATLKTLLADNRREFQAHPDAAKQLLALHEVKTPDASPIDTAAWAATARIILNLDEFITRE